MEGFLLFKNNKIIGILITQPAATKRSLSLKHKIACRECITENIGCHFSSTIPNYQRFKTIIRSMITSELTG